MRALPHSLSDCKALVRSYLNHTRPVSEAEVRNAINYGVNKAAKAVLASRPQAFLSYAEPFSLLPGVTEYDLGNFDPPLWRPMRLLVVGNNSGVQGSFPNQRSLRFMYKSLIDADFQEREVSGTGAFDLMAYDILSGMLPRTAVTITQFTAAVPPSPGPAAPAVVSVSSTVDIGLGTLVKIVGAGPPDPVAGTTTTIPGTYYGTVVGVAGPGVSLVPSPTIDPTGLPLVPLWRSMMKVAPAIRETLIGRLYYNYRQPELVSDQDTVEPIISEHINVVIMYALAILKRAVGDADSRDYFEDGGQQRSELIQEVDPASNQSSEALGSDLFGD